MEWLIFALVYASVGALSAFLDKVLLNYKIDPTSISSFRLMTNAIMALPFLLLLGFQMPSASILMMMLFGSALYSIAVVVYFVALDKDDASKMIPYRDSVFIIASFALAVIVLTERTNAFRILGALAVALGGYFVLTNGRIVLPKASSALILMGISSLLVAIFGVVAKNVLTGVSPLVLIFYNYLFVGLILFGWNVARNHNNQVKTLKRLFAYKRILAVSLLASAFAVIAWYSMFMALSLGNASQALPVGGVLPLFVAILGATILKERYGIPRILATLLVVAGIYAIYI